MEDFNFNNERKDDPFDGLGLSKTQRDYLFGVGIYNIEDFNTKINPEGSTVYSNDFDNKINNFESEIPSHSDVLKQLQKKYKQYLGQKHLKSLAGEKNASDADSLGGVIPK